MSIESSEVQQAEEPTMSKREIADLLIKDLEAQAELKIKEAQREVEAMAASITTMYKVKVNKFAGQNQSRFSSFKWPYAYIKNSFSSVYKYIQTF